jgi:hypothetical protein
VTPLQLRMMFLTEVVPLYNDQVDVFLMMTTSLSSIYLIVQYLNKMRQRELNAGIKDFDEKIPIIANLTFSLVIALFNPQNLNAQQRCRNVLNAAAPSPSDTRVSEFLSWSLWLPSSGRWHLKRCGRRSLLPFCCSRIDCNRGRACSCCTTSH